MSQTLEQIFILAARKEIRISDHGYNELANDGIFARDIVGSLPDAELLEDYPNFHKGACVLVLQRDRNGNPIHAVWGIPKNETSPAVLVTAYRPDPTKWSNDFRSRK
ncbi:DUF4258 domain-containing protein [Pontiella sp.]|uniref:DUF4258 domain-containing protein n=1 Tax=Pontiella sp. TaxID=2837462 RepID=UPI00356AA0A8